MTKVLLKAILAMWCLTAPPVAAEDPAEIWDRTRSKTPLFREPVVVFESRGRSKEPENFTGVWGKPVALLINERTTSGKELFAYVFKKLRLGRIIGSRTAGAVVAGRLFPLDNGDALYLAISDLKIDGQRLEGMGVEPDHVVHRPLEYAAGADPQLDAAIETISKR